ncbi:hypothetical protein [uncultured Polaribacter sp.]|uniref:phenylacetate--CoA ligase family protein n=1 Tax=uncultured Polaribacter sp. TaxID=174711 RepID=UPI00260744B2|nr:hypothetical protein [uncultured Polaribacter sp.]
MNFLNKMYHGLPMQLQNFAITMYGFYWKNRRLGATFKREVLKFKERESFTHLEWENYQEKELRKLLINAFKNVPFYHDKYSKAGFSLEDFTNFKLSDLPNLPYLEKEDLRKFGTTTLLSKEKEKEKGKFLFSSGSTGTPVSIYFSKKTHQKWFAAYEARVLNWAGVSAETPRGMIGGRKVIGDTKSKPPYFRINKAEQQTYFSAYHINNKTVANYAKGIIDNKVEYMVGYAMSNYYLAKLFLEHKINIPKLKAVITSSEKLTDSMRKILEKVYGCKTFDTYSGMEACGLVSQNRFGDFLFSPDTGVLELVDKQGNAVENGKEGEVLLTGLLNFDQPLIRYRIGDRATKNINQNTVSELNMPSILEINGRIEDCVFTKDGREINRFHSLFLEIKGLMLGQIIQEEIENFRINLVVENTYAKSSENIIKSRLENQIGDNIEVKFIYLKDVPKNKNGKFRAVINNITNG